MISGNLHINLKEPSIWKQIQYFFSKKSYTLKLPETWREIPESKIGEVFAILAGRDEYEIPELELLLRLCDVPPKRLLQLGGEEIIDRLVPHLSWMLTETCQERLVKHIDVGSQTGYLFEEGFVGVDMAAYRSMDEAYADLFRIASPDKLNDFLATCLDVDTGTISTPGFDYYVLHYYMANKQALYEKFFPGASNSSSKEKEPESDMSWEEIFISVAKNGVFGSYHEVEKTPVITFFTWMGQNRQQYLKDKQEQLQQFLKAQNRKFLA